MTVKHSMRLNFWFCCGCKAGRLARGQLPPIFRQMLSGFKTYSNSQPLGLETSAKGCAWNAAFGYEWVNLILSGLPCDHGLKLGNFETMKRVSVLGCFKDLDWAVTMGLSCALKSVEATSTRTLLICVALWLAFAFCGGKCARCVQLISGHVAQACTAWQ